MPYKNHVISTSNERLTSGFRTPSRPTHDGVDFTDADRLELKQDVKILAFEDGVVVFSGMSSASAGMGYYIDIRHEFNGKKYFTRYCHFKSASPFKTGQAVKKGDVIGVMGTTGNSTGIHLHFGLKENSVSWDTGTWVNPEPYLTGEKSMRSVESVKTIAPPNQMLALSEGNIAAIQAGAVYGGLSTARGKPVPASQLGGKRHTVSAVATHYGEREALLKEINSWVAVKFLVCVV